MADAPTYDQLFCRNLGVFTADQQERLRQMSVAVAGCGGIGSPTAVCLARLGVGEIRVADPEVFEPSNINRQFGAYVDTVGMNKASVVASEIARINPHAKVVCEEQGITSENCGQFIAGADCVVDAVDFYAIPVERVLHRLARANGQWVVTGLQAGTLCVFTSFAPDSRSFDELFCTEGEIDTGKILRTYFPVRPPEASDALVDGILAGQQLVLRFLATATMIAGGLVVESILRRFVWETQVVTAPDVLVLELRDSHLRVVQGQ